jgi:hypothetical protein
MKSVQVTNKSSLVFGIFGAADATIVKLLYREALLTLK